MTQKILYTLAALGVTAAITSASMGRDRAAPAAPYAQPPRTPYVRTIGGAGLVEARSENVSVAAPSAGVVVHVAAKVGAEVEAGAELFRQDDRSWRAQAETARASLAAAESRLAKLVALPRPESLPPLRARVRECEARLEDQRTQLARFEALLDRRAVSEDEVSRRRFAALTAERELERARADLAETEAGAWAPDLVVARADVESARGEVRRIETEIDRLTVRAPVAGRVLQVNVRAGEMAGGANESAPPVMIGDLLTLHVRIDIDEADASRFQPGAIASASLKGRSDKVMPLRFVRVEPYVVPKRSLTGLSNERVDTRVLQVVYAFEGAPSVPVYVGQQVDAFIQETTEGGVQ